MVFLIAFVMFLFSGNAEIRLCCLWSFGQAEIATKEETISLCLHGDFSNLALFKLKLIGLGKDYDIDPFDPVSLLTGKLRPRAGN